MKKCVSSLLLLALFCCLLASCQAVGTDLSTTQTENVQAPLTEAPEGVDLVLYRLKAQTHILQTAEFKPEWEGAQLGKYYLWYNPVTGEAPAYVEFQVLKEGDPAGYIMLSLTELDFDIPEYHTEGKTVYELLEEKANSSTIRAVRFNAFGYMAEVQVRSEISRRVFFGALDYLNEEKSRGNGNENGGYEEYLKEYLAKRRELGAIGGSKTELEGYYETLAQQEAASTRGNPQPPYPGRKSDCLSDIHLLPTYNQYDKTGSFELSGCGPTAVAIVLAYYAKMYNRRKLWPGGNPPAMEALKYSANQSDFHNFCTVTNALREYLGMAEGNSGSYTNWLPEKLSYYSYSRGCGWIPYQEVYGGDSWTGYGFARLLRYLKSNSPAFLGYEESKKSGHAVVIYKAVVQRDWTNNYKECSYYVFMGWGKESANWNTIDWNAKKGKNVPILGTKIITTWDYNIKSISMQSYTYLPD